MQVSRGTALVLALVLLTALLLLGLPFLYLQSSSMAGSRSFAARQLVGVARASAQNLGVGVGVILTQTQFLAPPPGAQGGWRSWSSLPVSARSLPVGDPLAAGAGLIDSALPPELSSGSLALSPAWMQQLGIAAGGPAQARAAWGQAQLGVAVSDESGKLDPNLLSAIAWSHLLTAVGITDWNDQLVYPNPGMPPPGGFPPTTYVPSADALGQLAKALAGLSHWLPQGRLVVLEQLLEADPQHPGGPGTPRFERLRWPLTRTELERLRPHLTLHSLSPGRAGLIDLGTVLQVDPITHAVFVDSQPDPLQPVLGIGSRIVSQESAASGAGHASGVIIAVPLPGLVWGDGCVAEYPFEVLQAAAGGGLSGPGSTLMLQTPAPLNLHQLTPAVRAALTDGVHPLPVPTDGTNAQVVPTIGGLWTVPGRGTPAQPLAVSSLAGWIDPVHSGIELPPLGIATQGVVAIDTQALIVDAAGQPLAQEGGTSWAQALPQEHLLERHWLTQGDWHGLLAARWGSRLQSWPNGYERLTDLAPDDHDFDGEATLAEVPVGTGVRPRPLADEALAYVLTDIPARPATVLMPELCWPLEQRPFDWRVGFGMGWPVASNQITDAETFVRQLRSRAPATVQPANVASCVRPDGFYHATSAHLAYSLASNLAASIPQSALLLPRDASQELGARHLGLWVRPESDWASGIHPLLSVRMPVENAGRRYDGSTGDPGSENVFSLAVDADRGVLVLALAPPTVEALGDAGSPIDRWVGTDPQLDHQCLGEAPIGALAPDPYADHADPNIASSLGSFSRLFARNRVLHCFATPVIDGHPYFRAGQWYRIDVMMASDRPDGVALLVDGMAGQDAAHLPAPRLSQPGDHFSLPGLVLGQALPGGLITSSAQLALASVAVAVPPPLSARSVLPAWGVVRIDDEYISYQGISADGTALLDCWRGRRQSTVATSADPSQVFPTVQAHAVGALVSPGGYRVALYATAPANARLYRGGCALAAPLGLGDPASPAGVGAIWVAPAAAAAGAGAAPAQLLQSGGSVLVNPGSGAWAQFPPTGIILIGTTAFAYGAKGPATLGPLTPVAGGDASWTVVPAGALPATGLPPQGLMVAGTTPILLVGVPLQGADPTQPGRYVLQVLPPSTERMVSLQDLVSGSVEWLSYDGFARASTGQAFLIDRSAFADAHRHRSRTPALSHAAGTLVLPVQSELGGCGHWLMTGDSITLLPRAAATGAPAPGPAQQLLVRYAATDGWGADAAANVDCQNDDVAFAEAIPDTVTDPTPGAGAALLCSDWEIACGDAWSGADLSPARLPSGGWAGSAQPRGLLPRLDLWSHALAAQGIDAQVVIAADDPATPQALASDCTIDDLCAGGLTGSGGGLDGHDAAGLVPDSVIAGIRTIWYGAEASGWLPAQLPDGGAVVEATTPIFAASGLGMGLVQIDGEVMAYEQPTAADAQAVAAGAQALGEAVSPSQVQTGGRFARLVGRGLLSDAGGGIPHLMGSTDPAAGPLLPDGQRHGPLLTAIRLPLGPVRMLDGDLGDAWWGLTASDGPDTGPSTWVPLGASQALVCAADGSRRELVQVIGPRQELRPGTPVSPGPGNAQTTASWLRGLYNTPGPAEGAGSWSGTANAPRPIVIGWWPRYASAMSAATAPLAAQLHSRSFPWLGCPVAVAGGYFDASLRARLSPPWSTMPLVSITADPDPEFQLEARAGAALATWGGSAPAMDWSLQQPVELPAGGLDPADASALFTPAHDGGRSCSDGQRMTPCDGIELRVSWRYATPPSTLFEAMAMAGNRAPTIHAVRIRYLAPARILSQQDR